MPVVLLASRPSSRRGSHILLWDVVSLVVLEPPQATLISLLRKVSAVISKEITILRG